MTKQILIPLTLLLLLTASPASHADSWPNAETREVFSSNRNYFVRVIPGNNFSEVYQLAHKEDTSEAKAEFYKRRADKSYEFLIDVTLKSPIAPVEFMVTDEGYLATVDNWQNMGHGTVIAFYTPDGIIVRSYTLKDLFNEEEIDQFKHTVSSIPWIEDVAFDDKNSALMVYVIGGKGGNFTFDIKSGEWKYCENRKQGYTCRYDNAVRKWTLEKGARD